MAQLGEKAKNILQTAGTWCLNHIKGLLSLAGGIFLVIISIKVFLYIALFSAGAFLIYYGLTEFKATFITRFIDKIIAKIKTLSCKQR